MAGVATEMALFDAELMPVGNFATEMALFGAELCWSRGFATEMALFDAERARGAPAPAPAPAPAGAPAPASTVEAVVGRGKLVLCQIVGKIDLVSYLNGFNAEMFI